MCTSIIKNHLRTFLALDCEKNKNIKAWQKNRSSYKKKSVARRERNCERAGSEIASEKGVITRTRDEMGQKRKQEAKATPQARSEQKRKREASENASEKQAKTRARSKQKREREASKTRA